MVQLAERVLPRSTETPSSLGQQRVDCRLPAPALDDGRALRNGKGPTRAGRRLRHVTTARKAALLAGQDAALWNAAYQVTKLTGYLMSLNIEDAGLDEHGLDVLNDLTDDVLYLQDWSERALLSIQARLG